MLIGIPKEIKNHEYRVGMTPGSVRELVHHGHEVYVETHAGAGLGFSDQDYLKSGAKILNTAQEIFKTANLIIKVKEPQPQECAMLNKDHVLFTYLHLAPDPEQTQLLLDSGCTAIAYETVTDRQGRLPLLSPMSEVAGRMSIQAGAHCLERAQGGRGVLLGGVPGVGAGDVLVIGGGVVGLNAIKIAIGMGANVTVLDRSISRIKELDDLFGSRLNTLYSTHENIERCITQADLVIGAVLVPGAAAPKIIKKEHLSRMRRGSVIVDVAIDQGGCCETSRATTHAEPTYVVDHIVHYCVANMPGAVARTSTMALNNATLPYVLALADKGYHQALLDDEYLRAGLNIHRGLLTCEAVGKALNRPVVNSLEALG